MEQRGSDADRVGWLTIVAILLFAPCIGWAIAVFTIGVYKLAVHPQPTGFGYWAVESLFAALPFALPGILLYIDRKRRLAARSEKNA